MGHVKDTHSEVFSVLLVHVLDHMWLPIYVNVANPKMLLLSTLHACWLCSPCTYLGVAFSIVNMQ